MACIAETRRCDDASQENNCYSIACNLPVENGSYCNRHIKLIRNQSIKDAKFSEPSNKTSYDVQMENLYHDNTIFFANIHMEYLQLKNYYEQEKQNMEMLIRVTGMKIDSSNKEIRAMKELISMSRTESAEASANKIMGLKKDIEKFENEKARLEQEKEVLIIRENDCRENLDKINLLALTLLQNAEENDRAPQKRGREIGMQEDIDSGDDDDNNNDEEGRSKRGPLSIKFKA